MALVGNLKDLKLPNIIQLNCMERNVARMTIEARDLVGEIFFQDGQMIHAIYNGKSGEGAVHELLLLKEGLFRIENGIKPTEHTIQNSWSNLLLEGLRVIDEGKETVEGQLQDMKQSILAVKGVMECEILNEKAEIVASSVSNEKRIGYSYLVVFSYKEARYFAERIDESLNFFNMKLPSTKIICFKYGTFFIVVEYEQKYQAENIIPNVLKFKKA